jgi:hypothetical protein
MALAMREPSYLGLGTFSGTEIALKSVMMPSQVAKAGTSPTLSLEFLKAPDHFSDEQHDFSSSCHAETSASCPFVFFFCGWRYRRQHMQNRA